MSFDWQNLLVVVAVIAASTYLARGLWQALRQRSARCRGCNNCASEEQPKQPEVFSIGQDSGPTGSARSH